MERADRIVGFGHQVGNMSCLWKTWHCLNGTSKHNSFEYRHLAIGLFSRAVGLDYPVRINGNSPYLSCHLTRTPCSYVKYLVQCLDYYSKLLAVFIFSLIALPYHLLLLVSFGLLPLSPLSLFLFLFQALHVSLLFACTQCLLRSTGIGISNLYSPMTVPILYSGKTINKVVF